MLRRLIIKITRLINKSLCAFYEFHCMLDDLCTSRKILNVLMTIIFPTMHGITGDCHSKHVQVIYSQAVFVGNASCFHPVH
jgi:hypothetical protein